MSENENTPIEKNLNWEVRPYLGVGPIDFGMTREEVRKIMKEQYGEEVKEVEKFSGKPVCDVYFDFELFVFYKSGDLVDGFELSQKIAHVKIQGELIDFENTNLDQIVKNLFEKDEDLNQIERWTYISSKFGLAFGSINGADVQSLAISSKERFKIYNLINES